MLIKRFLALGFVALLLSGCQTRQIVDFDALPPTAALPEMSQPGQVQLRYFDNISGNRVEHLLASPKYPDNPDEVVLISRLEGAVNRADQYGSLVTGFIQPPTSGEYQFFVSGDDETQLWLSDSSSVQGLRLVASVPGYTQHLNYTKYASQSSGLLMLDAGQRYYFELRHKEGTGGDHFSVAWQGPGISQQVIDAPYLFSNAQTLYPEDEASIQAFALGYRIGFFDGSKGLPFRPDYPPLDEDQDGLYDNWEIYYGLDPTDPRDANIDHDGDLLTALDEFWLGTDPTNPDTSGDGLTDGEKFAFGLDPLDPTDVYVEIDGEIVNLYDYLHGPPEPELAYVPGFVGQYFSGRNLEQFVLARHDPEVNFNWGSGSPHADVPRDLFSARWVAIFTAPHTEGTRTYQFNARRDDGIRVYVNNTLILNAWTGGTSPTYTGSFNASAGGEYAVHVEYYEGHGNAWVDLWIRDTVTGQTLNVAEVFKAPDLESEARVDTVGDGIPDAWALRYGLNPWVDSSATIHNAAGISSLQAYEAGLHPWTLEEVSEPVDSAPEMAPPPTVEPDAPTGTVTLSWTAPGTRMDGSSISLSEIDHYRISYGQDTNNLAERVNVPAGTTSHTFEGLAVGTWYFRVQVVDTDGLTSPGSEIVSAEVR